MNGRYKTSSSLLNRCLKTIPLASQTFSKSITQFPEGISPLFIDHGKGSHVWDVDGNEYVDFVNGLLSVLIGYSDEEITAAVVNQIKQGIVFSLPHVLEMEVAEMLVELVPCAEQVRFGKNGSDATSAAIRLARAYTSREHVLVCGYHGWQDWYIGSTSRDLGVPNGVKDLTHTFEYNDVNSLKKLLDKYNDDVAAVIMEPMNISWPKENFLEQVKELTHQAGALLIFDETITGCRFAKGGAQELFGVIPDVATFGKGLANGFPLSAVVGNQQIMKYMEHIFFSSTFGGETASLASAKVVLTKIKHDDVVTHLNEIGQKILEGVDLLIDKHDISRYLEISGHPTWSIFTFNNTPKYSSWDMKTLFLQEVFKRGVLTIGSHNISYAHTLEDVNQLLKVYDEVFPILNKAVESGSLNDILEVESLQPIFKVR